MPECPCQMRYFRLGSLTEGVVEAQMVDSILSKSSCIDQGVHNYLIYSGMLQDAIAPNPLHILPLEAGIVAQVQSMPPVSACSKTHLVHWAFSLFLMACRLLTCPRNLTMQ